MSARVAVAADDRQAGERQPQLRPDHVDDPLMTAPDIVERDAELGAVRSQRLDLPPRQGIADVELVIRRDVVIDGRECQVRPADPATGQPEPIKRLRAGHFMNQVTIDVEERRLLRRRRPRGDSKLSRTVSQAFPNRPRGMSIWQAGSISDGPKPT